MIEFNWLKNNHQMIHYFGLGFIQLKIDQEHRLHFYTPELPPIVPEEDIHNHRYDFTSTIIKGELTQEIFEVSEGDTHTIEEESCKQGVKCNSSIVPCRIQLISKQIFLEGSQYWINNTVFHRVSALNCITLVKRSEVKKELAKVIRPKGAISVCPFSKKIEESHLWEIVEMMLK
jgi:hypothetical protein